MLYYLFKLLENSSFPGARLMDYITFRSGAAFVLSLIVAIFIGRKIINRLQLAQVGEIIRDLGLEGQMKKTGTPTMGGIIIIIAILIPCLLLGNLSNVYMILMLVATLWLGVLGFLDDYIKVHRKDKDGLKGKFKVIGQIGLGLIVGLTMLFSPAVTMRENVEVLTTNGEETTIIYEPENVKEPLTTIPFVKNHNFDYTSLSNWMGKYAVAAGWIIFILVVIFLVTATSNGANLTDGLDGLATGSRATREASPSAV